MASSWSTYRPSKAVWFWSCVGCVFATVVIGFAWGGWVTGGSAEEMAADARVEGRAQLAARICAQRFLDGPEAGNRLAAFNDEGRWQRENFIEDGGWTTFADLEEPVEGAAELCAERLAEAELPATTDTAEAVDGDTELN